MAGLVLVVWLGTYALAVRWVYHDAIQRGHDGLLALAVVSALWPAGLFLRLMIRSVFQLAPEVGGSAWG